MRKIRKAFGFYPKPLGVDVGPIRVRCVPDFDEVVAGVLECNSVDNGWIYAPLQQTHDFMSGQIRERPFSARVFGLRKTHIFEHAKATGEEHLAFHLWALSFFLGMRLSATDAGFVDATSIKPGALVDFVLLGRSLEQGIDLGEDFWIRNSGDPRNAQRFAAAVHALFLAQYPQALQFEEFINLYAAIDACYALTKALRSPKAKHGHNERIDWMCGELGVKTPIWAQVQTAGAGGTVVSALRNDALHEALFAHEPLGFAVHGVGAHENITLEMNALVCRLLVALIGGKDSSYLASPVDTRQRHGLSLC